MLIGYIENSLDSSDIARLELSHLAIALDKRTANTLEDNIFSFN